MREKVMRQYQIKPRTMLMLILFLGAGLVFFKSWNPFLIRAAEEVQMRKSTEWSGNFAEGWKQYDQLIKEQKFEAASTLVEKMLGEAKSAGHNEEWVRSLVRYTQLRMALHGYETSVRFLKEQAWPKDQLSNVILNLFYAQTLVTYLESYSWEINQREKVESSGVVDLKAWTKDQIFAEAQKAFAAAWHERELLGQWPAAKFREFITPNNYPAGIRPTLRDAVTYLWVATLGNTTGWRPEQLNEVFRLNLQTLLGPVDKKTGTLQTVALTNPDIHPLEKICFLLDDLESWHGEKGEQEAALEARLERYRHLQTHFKEAADRQLIVQDLTGHLKPLRQLPWWSEGMAQMAEFVRQEDKPDALVRARELALAGHQAFPDSIGGKHCLAIQKSIEAPDYELSGMQNDGPQKKSILLRHKNLNKIYFRAYTYDLKQYIEHSNDYNIFPQWDEFKKTTPGLKPSYEWDILLPATPDYRLHKTFLAPPMDKPGAYLVVASATPGFTESNNKILGQHMIIGDLVMVTRQNSDLAEVTVLGGAEGKPVVGAEVILYQQNWRTPHKALETQLTDEKGMAHFQRTSNNNAFLLFARKDGQYTVDPQQLYLYPAVPPQMQTSTLFFTDRSIYRPQQKILWKAVAYQGRGDEARFATAPNRTFTVSLTDLNRQIIESKTVTTNEFGTASGEFNIPTGRALGHWALQSSLSGETSIQVEEYKRPTFEVKFLDPEKPLRLNKAAQLKGEAKYYFGLPVTTGKVKWVARREPVFPWWWSYYWRGGESSSITGSQIVANGTSSLDENGNFLVNFTPEIDERLGKTKDLTYRYSLSAEITDEGGETRTAQRSFRLGFVSVEAVAQMQKTFFLKGSPVEIKIFRSSLDGVPRTGKGSWHIVSLQGPKEALLPVDQPRLTDPSATQPETYRTPGDQERERWQPGYQAEAVLMQWAGGATESKGSLQHDEQGIALVKISHLNPGAYRLIYETTDDFGEKCEIRKEFLVADPGLKLSVPAVFQMENTSVKVGEKARLLVHSGLKNQMMILEFFRNGKSFERRQLLTGSDPSLLEIPITEKDRGGMGFSLTLLRDHQIVQLSQSIFVPWDNKELKLSFSTFRDRLRPGQQEHWTVKVTDPAGKDVTAKSAELLAYMYDHSLDAFVPHYPANPLNLYPNRTSIPWARANLGLAAQQWMQSRGFISGPGYPSLISDRLQFYSGYGIGGPGIRGQRLDRAARMAPMAAPAPMVAMESSSGLQKAVVGGVPGGVAGGMVGGIAANEKKEKDAELRDEGTVSADKPASAIELRSNFNETAFWHPHLLTGSDGSVTFEFKVPDSVTAWKVWVHAITTDLKSGSTSKETRTVKDLMVRPYLPRFLREGDEAEIKVVVNNASDKELSGTVDFDIIDVGTEKSLLSQFGLNAGNAAGQLFTVAAGKGANLTFPIKTPPQLGQIAFKVTATSGDFSDGELRPIPILPGRMHLAQSRFITLRNPGKRVMTFTDLARNDDPTRIQEQMVITLDSQLFYSVLSALPYLVNYPYECTEQTLNRFLSTGILTSLYKSYPAIEKMARDFSQRQTQLETWDAADPNRKMALEETPWLQMAKGGGQPADDLINVLDSRIAKAQREGALAKLKKAQTSSGGFPWFPGGPPSPFMTLYILYGFSKALEFGVDVPRDMVQPAWGYLHRHYLDEIVREMMSCDCGWEFVTFINYVLSNYPDDSWWKSSFTPEERSQMLKFSFKHWKEHSPYLKGYLALTLKRMGRAKDAILVWESVMDSAKTAEDQGTFWAPEDRSWLWYNDTIETHAFAIRTDMELIPEDPKLDGMVLWIFLNKKLNHWKSTRATAEVVYSLAHYLKKTGQLGQREDATVTVGNQKTSFIFEPDQYTGKKNQIVIPGEKINPQTTSSITVEKESKGYLFASATWHFSTEKLPAEESGDFLKVSRHFFKRVNTGREFVLQPLAEGSELKPGDEVEVQLSLRSKHPVEYVHLRDPRGAGFEPVSTISQHKWDLGIVWYEEVRDSGTNFFFEQLPQGEYTFKYRLRATTAGSFKVAPATVQPMYAPEFTAYSTGALLKIALGQDEPTKN
jgi:alpha-2-macroglobulin